MCQAAAERLLAFVQKQLEILVGLCSVPLQMPHLEATVTLFHPFSSTQNAQRAQFEVCGWHVPNAQELCLRHNKHSAATYQSILLEVVTRRSSYVSHTLVSAWAEG